MIDELDNSQYEMVELPSKGECYPHKKGMVPVAYLLASDENIIFSPKLRNERMIGETLLKKKVLDKDIDVDELCNADREAILIWLRRTGYGNDYTMPTTKQVIDLSYITFEDFNYFGDESGHFDYLMKNGDRIKYRILPYKEETAIINKYLESDRFLSNDTTTKIILEALVEQTVSVNDNTDREYIEDYLKNISQEQLNSYLMFVYHNTPKLTTDEDFIFNFGDSLFYDIIK